MLVLPFGGFWEVSSRDPWVRPRSRLHPRPGDLGERRRAWHLVWEDRRLFPDRIEAWANGPVVRSLYDEHRGRFKVKSWPRGDASRLSAKETESIDAVLKVYGPKAAHFLGELTHGEAP